MSSKGMTSVKAGSNVKSAKSSGPAFQALPVHMLQSPSDLADYNRSQRVQVNEISKRREYSGKVRDRVLALAEACYGGQVLIDSATFEAITNSMVDIVNRIPHEPDFSIITDYAR